MSLHTSRILGQLRLGGDWALAHGDLAGLRGVASRLLQVADPPLRDDLRHIVDACVTDPDRAILLWSDIRSRLTAIRA